MPPKYSSTFKSQGLVRKNIKGALGRTEDETALKGSPYKPKTIERGKKVSARLYMTLFLDAMQGWQ